MRPMINSHNIADFNMSDGLTPHQVRKLNYNFQNIFEDLQALTDKAKRPVESLKIGSITMVASDQPAKVTNSGSKNNIVLNFEIPTGVEPKITEADILAVINDESPTGNRVLSLTGLSSFWAKVKAAIADISDAMVTGVKGDAESSYRRGNVNLTPANIGASPTGHTHDAADTVSGKFAVARIPNLNANKITAGTLALARGGTASDNTNSAINTVFAGPSSGSAGNASWRKLTAADIPNLNASKITAGTLDIGRIPTITPAKGGTGRTVAALSSKTIFSGLNVAAGGNMGTNTDVFDYRFFMATLASGCYCYGYRTGSTSSAGIIYLVGGKDSGSGARVILAQIAVATNGKCTYTAGGEQSVGSGSGTSTARNITGLYGLY